MTKKINEKVINYVDYLCEMLPKILNNINEEYEKNKGIYIYSSSNRAQFDRLRLEMNKTLMKINKEIYK